MQACTHKHTATQFSQSFTQKSHQQLGGGLPPLPYYHRNSISHIWVIIKTLLIFILPGNRSILILSVLSIQWVNDWEVEVLSTSDYHLVMKFLHLCGQGASKHIVNTICFGWCSLLAYTSTLEFGGCMFERRDCSLLKLKSFYSSCRISVWCAPHTQDSFYSFSVKYNSWKADKKLEAC